MQQIQIVNQSPFIHERVHVTTKNRWCECPIDTMRPAYAVNLLFGAIVQFRTCLTCNGVVINKQNDEHNRHFGFSGYDEVHDEQ